MHSARSHFPAYPEGNMFLSFASSLNVAQHIFSCLLIIHHFQFEWSHINRDEEKLPWTTNSRTGFILNQLPRLVLVSRPRIEASWKTTPEDNGLEPLNVVSKSWRWERGECGPVCRGQSLDFTGLHSFLWLSFLHNSQLAKYHWHRAFLVWTFWEYWLVYLLLLMLYMLDSYCVEDFWGEGTHNKSRNLRLEEGKEGEDCSVEQWLCVRLCARGFICKPHAIFIRIFSR